KKILEYISNKSFKKVYLIGPHFYKFKEEYGFNFFNSVDDFAKHIVKNPETGRFFLIKGSRGIKLEKCTDYL
ncbi:MAG: UDP-N-acetylmuramoyl-tripeptide--D-alanyl-D-alanine ligase, partial [Bacteroidales bacterium]|nr:UDP-N-acetylmuramoyl-tripeptide--D-alanyl-D-alanine ligase [Bacteroidales bacterium]